MCRESSFASETSHIDKLWVCLRASPQWLRGGKVYICLHIYIHMYRQNGESKNEIKLGSAKIHACHKGFVEGCWVTFQLGCAAFGKGTWFHAITNNFNHSQNWDWSTSCTDHLMAKFQSQSVPLSQSPSYCSNLSVQSEIHLLASLLPTLFSEWYSVHCGALLIGSGSFLSLLGILTPSAVMQIPCGLHRLAQRILCGQTFPWLWD